MKNVIILLVLILIKAIFSACDVSFTFLNRSKITQLAKRGNKRAGRIKELIKNQNRFFASIKISITLLEFAASGFAAETFLKTLCEKLAILPFDNQVVYLISMVIITIILSYISLVLGDLLPKKIAANYPERVSMLLVDFVFVIGKIIYPFEFILNISLQVICRVFHIKEGRQEKLTERELKMIIAEGKEEGLIDADSKRLLFNALKFDNLRIKDIMVIRDQTEFIEVNTSYTTLLNSIQTYNYTRFPVYEGNIDHIVGILNVKDIVYQYGKNPRKEIKVKNLMRPAFFVEKNDKVDDTFKSMQLNAKMMAIVIGNNGVVEGIVTMSDMLARLVGNIFDEHQHVKKESAKK